MNHFFRRLPLLAKLLIIAIVPLLYISYLVADLYREKSENVEQVQAELKRIRQSANISRLIDELQEERLFSFDYALTRNHLSEMKAQRPETDSIFQLLLKDHDERLLEFPKYTFLAKIDSVRNLIDSNRCNSNQVMHFYSSAIFRLNTLNRTPSLMAPLKTAFANMISQRLLSDRITYEGIINANVYNVLYTKKYMIETLLGTYGTYDVYKTYQTEFNIKASPSAKEGFEKLKKTGSLQPVDSYLDKLFTTFSFDSSYTYETWSVASSRSLNGLRRLQMDLLGKAENEVRAYYDEQVASKSRSVIYLVAITLFVAVLLAYIFYIINSSLVELKRAALRMAEGETGIQLQPVSDDAIGSLARSICKVDAKNKELAIAAQQIGDGKFDTPVHPRSKEDILGNAILQMQDSLQQYTTELKNSREEFIQLAELMPQIVWTAKPDGHIDYNNKKWYEITGAKESFGNQNWVTYIHPEDVGYFLTIWYRSIEEGQAYEKEYRIKDVRSGSYKWFLARAVPIKDDEGRVIKWFGTATDINDQKLQNEKLEKLVAERTMELNRSNEDLQQFAHVASHDLKEPLRKIRTFGNRLEVEFAQALPEKAKTYITKLQTSSERMSNMIESILSYSVINATEQGFEPIDLNALIDGIKNDLELMILQKEASITCKDLPLIKGAPTLIYQLFYNLVNNALKFSRPGVPPVIFITASSEVHSAKLAALGVKHARNYAHITIIDNGIGFNQEFSEKVFHVFARLNAKESYEGTGLGLALCKKIVHRHHGAIYAEGKEGEGSVFHIILPN